MFFFSSRRRHTRCGRDWSSDVCSSDLAMPRRLCPCSCSLRIAVRVFWSSMAHLLLKTFCHTTGLLHGLPKTLRQLFTFSFQEFLQCSLTKAPVRPSRDRAQHFGIGAKILLGTRCRGRRWHRLL